MLVLFENIDIFDVEGVVMLTAISNIKLILAIQLPNQK
jgi:hypothetical protein